MKQYTKNRKAPAYPNAADRNQILRKIVDTALIVVSCIGITAMILVLPILS